MIAEVGNFSLMLALAMGTLLMMLSCFARDRDYLLLSKSLSIGYALFIIGSYAILTFCFCINDFSVYYVTLHSSTLMPFHYRVAAVWGGHEGSMLLWLAMLSAWTIVLALFPKSMPLRLRANSLTMLTLVIMGLLSFVVFVSNPFQRLMPHVPFEGLELNPLLQDQGLTIHPPILYMGYVGFAVPFAVVMAVLHRGNYRCQWAKWLRPWVLITWGFLTLGIILGSWWAYRELGWGGWWFWDPVENSSLFPWLAATALIHSLLLSDKRKIFSLWSILLAIIAFLMTLVGTFLTRSGLITSVHAFANDPTRGIYILIFILLLTVFALSLFILKSRSQSSMDALSLLSREYTLLLNNMVLCVILGCILLGTFFPLIAEMIYQYKISVGPPYYNTVLTPIALPLFFIMGIAPFVNWKKMTGYELLRKMTSPMLTSVLIVVFIVYRTQVQTVWFILGLFVGVWVFAVTLHQGFKEYDVLKKSLSRLGMIVAHLGVAVMILGISLTSYLSEENDFVLSKGDSAKLGNYEFKYTDVLQKPEKNYLAFIVRFQVYQHGKMMGIIDGEKRYYTISKTLMTDAGIDSNLFRDLYISLGEELDNDQWAVKIQYKPFVRWIWLGGIIIFIGAMLAVFDRQYRKKNANR